jgi:cell division protein FtsL
MTSTAHAHTAVADSVVRPRPRQRTGTGVRTRGGILWIVVSGILLAGVVFISVAVLQLNLKLDNANSQRTKLLAQNAALQSQLSGELQSPRIESQAIKQFGLTYQDPSQYGYVNVGK